MDYNLFLALAGANEALVPLTVLCDDFAEILGEGTNLAGCIPYGIAAVAAFAIQTSLQVNEFCDGSVVSAQNDSAYFNTIAIFNNLNTGVNSITNQLTSTQNDLDTHITNVDSDVNAHITAIDADIDTHVAGINTNVNTSIANANSNLNAQITAIDTDIDGRVTAVGTSVANAASSLGTQLTSANTDIDTRLAAVNTNTNSSASAVDTDIVNHLAAATVTISTAVANADTDLNNHSTAVDTDLNTHLAAVDADVQAQGSQVGSQVTTLQAFAGLPGRSFSTSSCNSEELTDPKVRLFTQRSAKAFPQEGGDDEITAKNGPTGDAARRREDSGDSVVPLVWSVFFHCPRGYPKSDPLH
jgi:hypothetical protein